VAVSTVGGWVATRALRASSPPANGNIEDIIHSIEAVLPDGSKVVLGKGPPPPSAGPDLRHLMMGSEGTLGVITGRDLLPSSRPPRARAYSAFEAPDMRSGFALQRRMIQAGLAPARPWVRQYDEARRASGRAPRPRPA